MSLAPVAWATDNVLTRARDAWNEGVGPALVPYRAPAFVALKGLVSSMCGSSRTAPSPWAQHTYCGVGSQDRRARWSHACPRPPIAFVTNDWGE